MSPYEASISPLDAVRRVMHDVAEMDVEIAGMNANDVDASRDEILEYMKGYIEGNPFINTAVRMAGMMLPSVISVDNNTLTLGAPVPVKEMYADGVVEGMCRGLKLHTTFSHDDEPQVRLVHVLETEADQYTNQTGTELSVKNHVYVCGYGATIESNEFTKGYGLKDLTAMGGAFHHIDMLAIRDDLPLFEKIKRIGKTVDAMLNKEEYTLLRRQLISYVNSLGLLDDVAVKSSDFLVPDGAFYGDRPLYTQTELQVSDKADEYWLRAKEFRYGVKYLRLEQGGAQHTEEYGMYLVAEDLAQTEAAIIASEINCDAQKTS